jgi:hypothetical protein
MGRDPPDNRPPVRQQVNQADAGEGDQRFADRCWTDAEPLRQILGDKMLSGLKSALEHIGQERLNNRLAPHPVMTLQRIGVR